MARFHLVVIVSCLMIAHLTSVAIAGACPHIPHCKDCPLMERNGETRRVCTSCDDLFAPTFREQGGASYCRECSDLAGCWVCTNTTRCQTCHYPTKDGPDLNGQGTCSACAPNCGYCGQKGSKKCDTCKKGFRLTKDDLCEGCLAENCWNCQSSSDVCGKCLDGYFLDKSTMTCTGCGAQCKVCATANTCRNCRDGYFANALGVCERCPQADCRKCDQFDCVACEPGFYVNQDGKCDRCRDTNCWRCNHNSCDTCNGGYYLSNGICTSCGGNCVQCNNQSPYICLRCKEGKMVGGTCECAANCKSCAVAGFSKCDDDQCNSGYGLNKEQKCSRVFNSDDNAQ